MFFMNLEKYRSQMAQKYPNEAFVEETLENLKSNRSKLRVPLKKIGKAVGGASLLTAAAFLILVGAGSFRGMLSEVSITERAPEEEKAILADREALFMTPLSNPNHTVRISTENGKVAMNEDTTTEEIIACGGVIDSRFGFVGYERICSFLRAYRNGEAAELLIAELPGQFLPDRRSYQYIGLNEDGTVNGKYYLHEGERLSTFPFERAGEDTSYGVQFGYCAATSAAEQPKDSRSTVAGMAIDLSSYGRGTGTNAWNFIPVCTISDLLNVSDRDGETIREEYFRVLSNLGEKEGVNILWNGEYSTPAQLAAFLEYTKSGAYSYFSTTITDLTKTDEYEECFYALEYLDGKYRIFTMKNGFEGEFATAYFDGWTVEDDMLVFDNGSVEYRFPSVQGTADMLARTANNGEKRYLGNNAEVYRYNGGLVSGENWIARQPSNDAYDWHAFASTNEGGFTVYGTGSSTRCETLSFDPNDVVRFAADPRNLMKISEEYSEGELLAAEIVGEPSVFDNHTDLLIAIPEKTGKIKVSENTELWIPSESCDIREMPDGKSYLMITEAEWRKMSIRATTLDANNQRLSFFAHYYDK